MTVKLIEPGSGAERTREIVIPGEEFLIGRGDDCDLRVRLSDISRHHCLIRVRGGEAILSDLGSSNGTFLNGQRVRGPAVIHSGDEIRVGPCRFVVDLGDKPSPDLDAGADPLAATRKMHREPPADKLPKS